MITKISKVLKKLTEDEIQENMDRNSVPLATLGIGYGLGKGKSALNTLGLGALGYAGGNVLTRLGNIYHNKLVDKIESKDVVTV